MRQRPLIDSSLASFTQSLTRYQLVRKNHHEPRFAQYAWYSLSFTTIRTQDTSYVSF